MALLASLAIPALSGQAESAKIKMAEATIGPNGTLSQAIKLYKFNMNDYPKDLKNLVEKPSGEGSEKWVKCLEDIRGLKDPWDHDYEYNPEGKHNEGGFDLWSRGPNGKDDNGSGDDICNWKTDK